MSKNPYLNKLLQEAGNPEDVESQTPAAPSPEAPPAAPAAQKQTDPAAQQPPQSAPKVQELLQLWQKGDHMAVATKLMFTEANYVDFVDLVFTIGHEQARELGTLLDELANSENMQPPKTPPEYNELLRRAVGSGSEEEVV